MLEREAIFRLGHGLPARVEVAQAKAFASEKCLAAVRMAQQIHGGIGFIAEFDQQLWYRRVAAWSLRCGTAPEHRLLVAESLLDRQGPVRLGYDQSLEPMEDLATADPALAARFGQQSKTATYDAVR